MATWVIVIDWVETQHPVDFDTMFLESVESTRLSPESLALWRQYSGDHRFTVGLRSADGRRNRVDWRVPTSYRDPASELVNL